MAKYSQWLKELESQNNLLWAPWFIMAIIIGIGRLAEEALAVYLPKGGTISFGVAVNFVTFYAQTIWVYVGAASILTRQLWPRTMGPVMLGTLLGVLPPVIDVVIYGIGNFDYFYQFDYPNHIFGPIPVDLARGLPLGEVLIAYASVGLFAFYVGLRSRSTGRTVLALIAGYELMHFWGSGLPSLAARLEQTVHLSLTTTISLVQIAIIVGIYYSLNPAWFKLA